MGEPMGNCGEEGACELYDADKFRKIYFGILMGIKLLGMVFVILAAWKSHTRDLLEQAETEAEEAARTARRRGFQGEQLVSSGSGGATANALNSRLRAYSPAVHHQIQHSVQDSTLGALQETNEESEPLSTHSN